MTPEIVHWLQDIYQYRRVARRRKALRRPGQGADYTADRDTVRRVVSRLHPKRMRLRVVEVVEETPTTKTLRLARVDGPLPPWRPGQYVNAFVDVDGVLTSRPYSISSVPGTEYLDLTVRDKPGGLVAPYLLNQVQAGDELETTGPAGSFYHEPLIDGTDLVFLAGGSGVTPFMSIIRDALQNGRALDMHLLYGSRTPDDVIFGAELADLAARHAHLHYTLVVSEPPPGYDGVTGFLTADLIRANVGDVTGKTFYICGPNVMVDFCLAALAELGVPAQRVLGSKIKRELYGPPADVTCEASWPVGLDPDTLFDVEIEGHETIYAPAGEPLLNSLERYGIVVPAVCRAGECSACRTRLLSGRVFQPAHTGLRESDRVHGYIHACVSYPVEDIQIRLP
ncbi:MAG: 2Fe-2S iron-sulfur cluster binding domain-containing protein [Anaerolineae bacterium]|nr:2Fe-2S iron-sulfur cluster binding domain-containing protein [Anaerolineae bacterium]